MEAPPQSVGIQISALSAWGYRAFDSLVFHPKRITVLVGVNGAGKTSLLQAAAVVLSRLTGQVRTGRAAGIKLSDSDMRPWTTSMNLTVLIAADGKKYGGSFGRMRMGRSGGAHSSQMEEAKMIEGHEKHRPTLKEYGDEIRNRLTSDGNASVPIVVLYPVNRAVLDIPLRIRMKHSFDQVSVYEGAFEIQRNFRTFFEWFREREDLENELIRDGNRKLDRELEAVRSAIAKFMPAYGNLRVRRSPLRMTLDKGKETLLVSQLSDGEKAILSLVGDLARRLAIANPGRVAPLEGAGIVLVDEIELHLHPRWQRHAVEMLPTVFPNLQFIITTHSAVVANSAPRGSLVALRNGKAVEVDAYGQDVAVVLADIFGTEPRPAGIQARIDAIYDELEASPDRAEALIRDLEADLSPQDEALVRARARLARRKTR